MVADSSSDRLRVLTLDAGCPALPLVEAGAGRAGAGRAVAVVWPGTGAARRSMHHILLDSGAATVKLRHPGEAVYYVKSGTGLAIDPDDGSAQPQVEGSMIHIGPGTAYRFQAGEAGMELLGGPSPPDPALYAHL